MTSFHLSILLTQTYNTLNKKENFNLQLNKKNIKCNYYLKIYKMVYRIIKHFSKYNL